MRKIKFRAWDATNKIWLKFTDKNEYFSFDEHGELVWIADFERQKPIVMQYTGLRDRNETEIMESDICRQRFNDKVTTGEVRFSPTQGYLVGLEPIWPHDIEVIGNIYENPELLK